MTPNPTTECCETCPIPDSPHEEAQGFKDFDQVLYDQIVKGGPKFLKEFLTEQKRIADKFLSSSTKAAYDEGYKKGVEDEIECVKTSGEHLDLQKLLSPQSPDQGTNT